MSKVATLRIEAKPFKKSIVKPDGSRPTHWFMMTYKDETYNCMDEASLDHHLKINQFTLEDIEYIWGRLIHDDVIVCELNEERVS